MVGGHQHSAPTSTRAATSLNDPSTTPRQWCGLAIRYDKLAITYRAGVVLQARFCWSRLSGDTP